MLTWLALFSLLACIFAAPLPTIYDNSPKLRILTSQFSSSSINYSKIEERAVFLALDVIGEPSLFPGSHFTISTTKDGFLLTKSNATRYPMIYSLLNAAIMIFFTI